MLLVMKFGGNSVSTPERVIETARIVSSYSKEHRVVVILSAIKGITDDLLSICESIRRNDIDTASTILDRVIKIHNSIVENLAIDERNKSELKGVVNTLLDELNSIVRGLMLIREVTPRSMDYILSFGERLSVPILCYALSELGLRSVYLDGKDAGIVTDSTYGNAKPLMDTTRLRLRHRLEPILNEGIVPVITGFIGGDQYGNITTLGRGGSDYTATIVASCIDVDEIILWSDVDGLMTADPKIVKDAQVLREVSYSEAMEMVLFGAKYIHPRALEPIVDKGIPMMIKNIFKPDAEGTLVLEHSNAYPEKIVKAVTSIRKMSLIDVRGTSMIGSPGTAGRIFSLLGENGINIVMISQGPSESSISMVVRKSDLDKAVNALELNLLGRIIKSIDVTDDAAIIAVVGSGMRGTKGVAARVFSAVADAGINVIMIAQGSSELNLAFVIEDKHADDAVRALHKEFGLHLINNNDSVT